MIVNLDKLQVDTLKELLKYLMRYLSEVRTLHLRILKNLTVRHRNQTKIRLPEELPKRPVWENIIWNRRVSQLSETFAYLFLTKPVNSHSLWMEKE
jgi:hypothetical protein